MTNTGEPKDMCQKKKPFETYVSKRGLIHTRRKLESRPPLEQIPKSILAWLDFYHSPAFAEEPDKARKRDIKCRLRRYHLIEPAP